LGRHELALTQYRKGLELNSRNLTFRREEAFHLNRLGFVDDAIVKIENLLADVPNDFDAVAYLGRIYKEMWTKPWKSIKEKEPRLKAAFESYHWLIKAFETYLKAYRLDLDQLYPGVNALTLGTILVHLADKYDNNDEPDPDITWVRGMLPELRGSLIFALESKALDETADYWTLVSLAESRVLTADVEQQVTRAYRKALTASRRNQFFLQSSLDQLEMLHSLNMRSEFVDAGIKALKEELGHIQKEAAVEVPKKRNGRNEKPEKPKKGNGFIFLFTGYMINNPKKKESHFPPEKEDDIRTAINAVLDGYNAGANDLAISTGMDAGSEILFVESCVERGIPVQAYFPMPEAPYVRDFVSPGGEKWIRRFYDMRNHPLVNEFYQPDNVGVPKDGDNVHERNNRWALYSALARSIDKMRLIAVWDGKSETPKDLDARLVQHMVDLMRESGGIVEQIDPTKLSDTIVQVTTVTNNAHSSVSIKMNSGAKAKTTKTMPQKKNTPSKSKG
ncbi:MAG TPA: TRAFs-binding domain-containing protein, partial [Anaerolineales bacterium]|nr:TRAFs-binding domain-containing protein [Anaerolineales bacterium]